MSRASTATTTSRIGDPALAARLAGALEGEVLFDRFSRGRYATDASIYQIEPLGVVVPRTRDDLAAAIAIAAEQGVPLLPRGGGTSQCGQTVAEAIVVDVSKHLNRILDFDPAARRVTVEPGLVLDQLNAFLQPHGLMFPVDVSTSSRATLGGMAGNNSCGARSLAYGTMRDNVRAIDALLADGTQMRQRCRGVRSRASSAAARARAPRRKPPRSARPGNRCRARRRGLPRPPAGRAGRPLRRSDRQKGSSRSGARDRRSPGSLNRGARCRPWSQSAN